MTKTKIVAYTDGSAVANPKSDKCGLGGYGVYIKIEEGGLIVKELFFHEGYSNTKTGRMELRAMIICLQKVTNKLAHLFIYSDSMYVVQSVREGWLWNWEKNGWKGIANADLMQMYLEEYRKFRYKPIIQHIKGHQKGDEENVIGNCIADLLADYKQFKTYKEDINGN